MSFFISRNSRVSTKIALVATTLLGVGLVGCEAKLAIQGPASAQSSLEPEKGAKPAESAPGNSRGPAHSGSLQQDEADAVAAAIPDMAQHVFSAQEIQSQSKFSAEQASFGIQNQSVTKTVSVNKSKNCPAGGSVTVVGSATVELNINLPKSFAMKASSVSGTATFDSCQVTTHSGKTVLIDGVIDLSGPDCGGGNGFAAAACGAWGSLTATAKAGQQKVYDLKGDAAGHVAGNLHVKSDSFDQACDFDTDLATQMDGTVDLSKKPAKGTINYNVSAKGMICGKQVDTTRSGSVSF